MVKAGYFSSLIDATSDTPNHIGSADKMASGAVPEPAFKAFMRAYNEHGGSGLGFRRCLKAYEAAKFCKGEADV